MSEMRLVLSNLEGTSCLIDNYVRVIYSVAIALVSKNNSYSYKLH